MNHDHVAEKIAVNRELGAVHYHTVLLAGKDLGEALWAKSTAGVFALLVNVAAMEWEAPL